VVNMINRTQHILPTDIQRRAIGDSKFPLSNDLQEVSVECILNTKMIIMIEKKRWNIKFEQEFKIL